MPETSQPQAPFVGREALYARLHQHILQPTTRRAVLYLGRDGIGKTRLLQHFNTVFAASHPGVFIALRPPQADSAANLLRYLAQATTAHIQKHFYTPVALPIADETADSDAIKRWFSTVYLPAVAQIVRADRHLIWLMDDAHHLLAAGADLPAYLHQVLHDYHAVTIILTLNLAHEAHLPELAPLVDVTQVERLSSFTIAETTTLIRHFVGDMPDDTMPAIQEATGGNPRFVASFGRALTTLYDIRGDVVREVLPAVAQENAPYLEALWRQLGRDERLVLNAINSLFYDDPLQAIRPEDIESWLLETDFPTDITTIRVTLRGLEYQEIITTRAGSIVLSSGLLQKWLLENARLDETAPRANTVRWYWALLVAVGLGVLIAVLLAQPAPTVPDAVPPPTVTLAPG